MGGLHEIEFKELNKSKHWSQLKGGIKESKIGNPPSYNQYPESSGNLIHHAYSMLQIMEYTSIDFTKIKRVFEFGGGYGSSCRLLYQLGYTGSYTILDLPEFSCLQKYYLNSLPLKNKLKIEINNPKYEDHTVNLINQIKKPEDIDFFFALWSISEVPLNLRKKYSLNLII
ncbi:MAG: hypothetical protein R2753_17840 [Chitinophagales bacterium]